MDSPVRPGANSFDLGPASKAGVNTQPFNNQRLAEQNQLQNVGSAAPQAAADAMGKMRNQSAQIADAQNKAQSFANERMSEALFANESGAALLKVNSIMQSPEKGKFLHDIAIGKAVGAGMSPDLGSQVAQGVQYG